MPTGSLNVARSRHTATLLPNGKVLVVGGTTNFSVSAEIYDPSTGAWTPTRSDGLPHGPYGAAATLLTNGKVLFVGPLFSETYDAMSDTWTTTNGMIHPRRLAFSTTLLTNGLILVAGGITDGFSTDGCELFDPSLGTWTETGALIASRAYHTATLLQNGKVLVVGGHLSGSDLSFDSCELYDPASGRWASAGKLTTARNDHNAILLKNGKVLAVGGSHLHYDQGLPVGFLAGTELYDPETDQWTETGAPMTRAGSESVTLLSNGQVLAVGGFVNVVTNRVGELIDYTLRNAETYDPETGKWTETSPVNKKTFGHSATLLPDGSVLIGGGTVYGRPSDKPVARAELYAQAGEIRLIPSQLPDGAFRLQVTNAPAGTLTVLSTTNVALPLANWNVEGVIPSATSLQFVAPVMSEPQRFFTVRFP